MLSKVIDKKLKLLVLLFLGPQFRLYQPQTKDFGIGKMASSSRNSADHHNPDRKELKAKWKNEVDVETYKESEVSKHSSKTDCWITIHGRGNIPIYIV